MTGLASATANGLLVMFVLAVALPLLPTKLAGPFWLLASTGVFYNNGFLALLSALLLPMAAALEPQSVWHQSRRLLLLPLQGLAAWRGMEVAQSLAYRAGRVQQARLVQFLQAVERSATIAELQSQLAVIQVPPLSAADQRLGLPALKADLLSQIKAQESNLLK